MYWLRRTGFAVLFSLVAASARAQLTPQETTAVVTQAITKVRNLAPDGPIAVGFADSLAIPSTHASEMAKALGVELRDLRAVRVCTAPSPSACHLVGVRAFVQVDRISAVGDTAHVDISLMDETNSTRQPIYGRGFSVTLVRAANNAWRALGVTLNWVT
jgi:hypothetical protein